MMFTGIIEEVGAVIDILITPVEARIRVSAAMIINEVQDGASIAVNGVCLTVTDRGRDFLAFDLSLETLKMSTLKDIKKGDKVNLERGAKVGSRLDGHMVTGHVDGMGRLAGMERIGNTLRLTINCNNDLISSMVYKGSITVDGISLTITDLRQDLFSVYIVPFTEENTNIRYKKIGDRLNLETDIIGKYVARFLSLKENHKDGLPLNRDYLKEHGFI